MGVETGADRLLSWFDDGTLIRPSAAVPNFVDLVTALYRLAGVDGLDETPASAELTDRIGPADHYLFVLVDGMGADLVESLRPSSFLRTHLAGTLCPVFPSTTASALTTLATAVWPADHGVPGWWTYLPDRDLMCVTLPFWQRHTCRPLQQFGVDAAAMFPVSSVWPRLKHRPTMIVPGRIADSTYSRYAAGELTRAGYEGLPTAFAAAEKAVGEASAPSLTYLYLPQVDAVSHRLGPKHEQVAAALGEVEAGLGELAAGLAGRARIVVVADHGHTCVPPERRILLPADDPLAGHLLCQPVGEPTVPIFHVRDGHADDFAAEFDDRFGDHFALVGTDEAEQLRLFGPGPLSAVMRRRLGAFLGIAPEPTKFYISPADDNVDHAGVHGSLTPIEMTIPLILA